jgi:hypothetical protein
VTAHKTTYIYIEGVGQQTSEKIWIIQREQE